MFEPNWRDQVWSTLDRPRDLVIIGGGITGVGILREATRAGLDALLVEQRDFSWGTSSRSSKLVHGGLRYLKEGQLGLTRDSVRERQRLIGEGPGLIDPLGFLLAIYGGDSPGRWTFEAGLTVYDLLALHWSHKHYSAQDFQMLAPHLTPHHLSGGFRYGDAQTDDARLVLRILQEAVLDGGEALNYVEASGLLLDEQGRVVGVRLTDLDAGRDAAVRARVVVNATGAWSDNLRTELGLEPRIRPLRGSHLIFPAWRFPVAQAISFLHPIDRRPVFAFPWEGITLVGTTDVDHYADLNSEPCTSPEEVAYLMAAVQAQFAPLNLELSDIVATFAGIRPVIDTGKDDPSKESRDHVIWYEAGLLTVTGGKLTTFRLIALDVLQEVEDILGELPSLQADQPVLDPVDPTLLAGADLNEAARRRLLGRYGVLAPNLMACAAPGELQVVPGTRSLWAELRWGARAEGVVHLDDLLLRRVRLGLLLDDGGSTIMPTVRAICQPELGWDDAHWQEEEARYLGLWHRCYGSPDPAEIPDWLPAAAAAVASRRAEAGRFRRARPAILAAGLGTLALALTWYFWKSRDTD
jgi:glycerol-3-phosphate dehydrogenase